jgi:hypothetical protein
MRETETNYRLDGEPEPKRKGVPFHGVWMPWESPPEFSCDLILAIDGKVSGGFYLPADGRFCDRNGTTVNPDWWAIAPDAP